MIDNATRSTNPLTGLLKRLGITSGRKLAEHTDARAVIYFLAKDSNGGNDPRAELRFRDQTGTEHVLAFRPDFRFGKGDGAIRRETLETAKVCAADLLGLDDWRKTPFSNCWLPVEAINRMRAELGVDPLD